MGTQAKALLFFVVAVGFTTSGAQAYSTWISNGASRSIVVSTFYAVGQSQFINRVIAPGTSQRDDYAWSGHIFVDLRVKGVEEHKAATVEINHDKSLVAYDHGGGTTGVDIYLARYGHLFQAEGPVLVTIFSNGLENETTTNTTTLTTQDLD